MRLRSEIKPTIRRMNLVLRKLVRAGVYTAQEAMRERAAFALLQRRRRCG